MEEVSFFVQYFTLALLQGYIYNSLTLTMYPEICSMLIVPFLDTIFSSHTHKGSIRR